MMTSKNDRQEPTRLILVRHGEPEEAVRGRCCGRLDPSLSLRGCAEMRTVRRRLGGLPIAIVYTSPLRRAHESARLVANGHGTIVADDRLREIDFGELEGLTYAEAAARYPSIYQEWMRCPASVTFPAGESFEAMRARVRAALFEILRGHAGSCVVVVSHGGVNRIALADALDLEPSRMFRIDQAYGCINVVDFFDGQPVVRTVNLVPRGVAAC